VVKIDGPHASKLFRRLTHAGCQFLPQTFAHGVAVHAGCVTELLSKWV
jgi:hypothetical protein